MASIHREIVINVSPEQVWSAMTDVGALHTRLVAGFVTDCLLEDGGGSRIVTFASGLVTRELIIDVNAADRRLVWASVGGQLSHHNAWAQVFADGPGRSRVVWIADLLPDYGAPVVTGMVEQGLDAMKKTLESAASAAT